MLRITKDKKIYWHGEYVGFLSFYRERVTGGIDYRSSIVIRGQDGHDYKFDTLYCFYQDLVRFVKDSFAEFGNPHDFLLTYSRDYRALNQ